MQNGFGETFWQIGLQNRSFRQQLWRTALGTTLWSSAGEQLWGAASSFREQLCTAALKNRSFGEHLWGVTFTTQLRGAIFGSNFGEQLSAALGQQLWRTALGTILWSSAGEQLWGAALGRSFEEQLCKAALKNFSFGEATLKRNFGEQLSVATLGSSFREPLWRIALGNRFEA